MMIGLVIGCGFSKTLVFSQGDLQAKSVGAFPVEKEKYRLTIQLSDPEQKATRLLLKEVRVADGKLHLKVGVG
jgi:hypothetical protein